MAKRIALLIGNAEFEHKDIFPDLRTPAYDAQEMADVLKTYGQFSISNVLINADAETIRGAIEDLYAQARFGDLTLLYYSGHGYRDRQSRLFLAARNTQQDRLLNSGIRDSFIQEAMRGSEARHRVIILDCCFSGTFLEGQKAGLEPLLLEKLKGEATSVLTSSGRVQFSFEEKGQHSLFTQYLIEGIKSGGADEDLDGLVEIDELFQFVDQHVRQTRPDQTPMIEHRARDSKVILAEVPPQILQMRQLEALYEKARVQVQKSQWQDAINTLADIHAQQPSFPDPDALYRTAEGEIERQKLRASLKVIYDDACAEISAENWHTALQKLNQIIKRDPSFLDAAKLLGIVQEKIRQLEEQADLPSDLYDSIKNASPNIRSAAVADLIPYLDNKNPRLAQLALDHLHLLAGDDSRRVSDAASQALAEYNRKAQKINEEPPLVEAGEEPIERPGFQKKMINLFTRTKLRITGLAGYFSNHLYWVRGIAAAILIIGLIIGGFAAYQWIIKLANLNSPPMYFALFQSPGLREIYRLESGGSITRITNTPNTGESWDPFFTSDGKLYFASTRDGGNDIYRLDSKGSTVQITNTPDFSGSWDPFIAGDGNLYFTTDRDGKREIYRLDSTGSTTRITNTPGLMESWDPFVALDGNLYFTSTRDGKREIYRLNSNGSISRITSTPDAWESYDPFVTRNGRLYFTSTRGGKREIYRLDSAGSLTQVTTTQAGSESWDPFVTRDGDVYFTSNRDGKAAIYLLKHGFISRPFTSDHSAESLISVIQ